MTLLSLRRRLNAFTLIELLVVIAIIAILAAILFPVFAQAREKARQATCASNEKQIGLACMQYQQDFDGGYPARYFDYCVDMPGCTNFKRYQWTVLVNPYIKQTGGGNNGGNAQGVYICPSTQITSATTASYSMSCDANWQYPYNPGSPTANWKGYVYHGGDSILYDNMVGSPAGTIFIGEEPKTTGTNNPYGQSTDRICQPFSLDPAHYTGTSSWGANHDDISQLKSDERHNGGVNYVFFDGHTKWMKSGNTVKPNNMWTLYPND